jgi:hypothetical protein
MKTPMQEVIEQLKKAIASQPKFKDEFEEGVVQGLDEALQMVESLLEKEKEQIIDAYEVSHISMMTAEQYYNETFNTKMREVDAYCRECDAYICDERVTFEECCDVCGTDIEYK